MCCVFMLHVKVLRCVMSFVLFMIDTKWFRQYCILVKAYYCLLKVDGGRATDDEKASTFNVIGVTSVGSSTYKLLQSLSLLQNGSYFIFVMGKNV